MVFCLMGMHRSVAMAEALAEELRARLDVEVGNVRHRGLEMLVKVEGYRWPEPGKQLDDAHRRYAHRGHRTTERGRGDDGGRSRERGEQHDGSEQRRRSPRRASSDYITQNDLGKSLRQRDPVVVFRRRIGGGRETSDEWAFLRPGKHVRWA